MASRLKTKNPDVIKPAKPKVLVFGDAGVGKTWGALSFPNTYFIDCEAGANQEHYIERLKNSGGIYFGQEDGSQDYEVIIEQLKLLATQKHEFRTLVIDSASHLQLLEIGKEVEKMMVKGQDMSKTFGAEKKPNANYSKRIVDWLGRIDMTVIIICHEKADYSKTSASGDTAVTYDAWDKFKYLLNLSLRVKRNGDSRIAVVQKSRFKGFPDGAVFNWDYEEFSKRYGKDVIDAITKPIELATKEQLSELSQLLTSWKSPEDWESKALNKAKCNSWDEMDSDKTQVFIDFIKNKLKGEK